MVSKLYRQMYANTGIATDSARVNRANNCARWLAKPCQRLFQAAPMPELQIPEGASERPARLTQPLIELGQSAEPNREYPA